MADIPLARILPEELAALGLLPGGTGAVKIADLPLHDAPEPNKYVPVDRSKIPEPAPAIVEAARRLEAGVEVVDKDPISTDNQLEFFVHLMGGNPFRKTYSYYGGKVKISIKTRSALEDELCAREVARLPINLPAVEYVRHYEEFALLLSLESLQYGDAPPIRYNFLEAVKAEPLGLIREKIFGEMSGACMNLVRTANADFLQVYDAMMARRNDPSFPKAGSPS